MGTIFVAKDGNDTNPGTDKASPKLTLASAYTAAVDGDQIVILTPEGEWFENFSSSGYINLGKASITTGIDFVSWDARRPARIGGVSGVYSIRCDAAYHRFFNIDFCTGASTNTSVFANVSNTPAGIEMHGCRAIVRHDIDSTGYAINMATAATALRLTDVEVVGGSRSIGGIAVASTGAVLQRVKSSVRSQGSAGVGSHGFRVSSSAGDITCIDCEFGGHVGILQSTLAASGQIRFIDCKAYGGYAAALFLGADSGFEARIITRRCRFSGINYGAIVQGSRCLWDDVGSREYSATSAVGCPAAGVYSSVRGVFNDNEATAWDRTSGTVATFGDGSAATSLDNVRLHAANAATGALLGGTGKARKVYVQGGLVDSLAYEGGVGWDLHDGLYVQDADGNLLTVRNGDPTPEASALDFRRNTCIVSTGTLFNIPSEASNAHDGTLVSDENTYLVATGETWGTVDGTTVTSLATTQSAWDNDASSRAAIKSDNARQSETEALTVYAADQSVQTSAIRKKLRESL